MDMDVECFRNTEAFLENYDMVFNIETNEGSVITNAVMASVPNAAIWQCVFENLQVGHTGRCSWCKSTFNIVAIVASLQEDLCCLIDVHAMLMGC